MKQVRIFFWIFFLIAGCTQTDYDYRIENIILDCFYQHHKDSNIDIKNSIDKIENVLIKHNILEDKSGNSYIRIIEQIRDGNDSFINDLNLLNDIKSINYIPTSIFCSDTSYVSLLDSTSIANSKFKYVIGIFDSIRIKENISPTLIADEILEVFNAEDFENDYYRTIGLITFSNIVKMNDYRRGLAGKLSSMPKEEYVENKEKNTFVILINAEDKILVDGKPTKVFELNELVKSFLIETSDKVEIDLPLIGKQKISKGIIYMRNEKGTSYDFYITVLNELKKVYKDIRDEYSLKFFNDSFDELDKEKQEVIKNLVPQRIYLEE